MLSPFTINIRFPGFKQNSCGYTYNPLIFYNLNINIIILHLGLYLFEHGISFFCITGILVLNITDIKHKIRKSKHKYT